jgi:hypothetical protein
MGAGRSGTSASSSGSKKSDAEGKGGTSAGGSSSSGGKSPSGGGTGARGPTGAGGTASHTGAKGPAGASSRSPSPSSPKSGPGGAGGVRNTSQGTRQSQPAARVGSSGGTILSNPSRAAQSMGGLLNSLNRQDRQTVEAGTRFGQKLGTNTAYGISLMDPQRFGGFRAVNPKNPVNFANVPDTVMNKLINTQLAYGKQIPNITAGFALKGHKAKGAHPLGLAFDLQAATPNERFALAEAAKRAGFTHFGTYGPGKTTVHVDARPGTGTWGPSTRSFDTAPELKAALNRAIGPVDWDSVAANIAGQRTVAPGAPPSSLSAALNKDQSRISPSMDMSGYRSPMTGLGGMPTAARPTSSFPGRPEMPGALPAEDRMPSTFPGRPSVPGSYPAARPQSTFPGRPEVAGSFPGAQPQSFPGRPEFPGSFPAEDRQPSALPGRPTVPGAFPSARAPSAFPGRPDYPGSFPAEDRQPSSFPGRPGFLGPGFPAAPQQVAQGIPNQPGRTNPVDTMGAPPAAGERGLFASLGEAVKEAVQAPAKKIGDLANLAWDNINNPDLSFVTPRQPGNPLMGGGDGRGTTGSTNVWTGREPPQAVAQMQQHVEQVLRAYLLQMQNAA